MQDGGTKLAAETVKKANSTNIAVSKHFQHLIQISWTCTTIPAYYSCPVATAIYFGVGHRTSETYSAFRVTVVFLFLSSIINPALYLWRMNNTLNEVR